VLAAARKRVPHPFTQFAKGWEIKDHTKGLSRSTLLHNQQSRGKNSEWNTLSCLKCGLMNARLIDVAMLIVALLSIVATIAVYWLNDRKSKKELAYEYSSTSLTSWEQDFGGRLRILFDDQPITAASFVGVIITNSGNIPIVVADFHEDMHVTFDKGELLTTALFQSEPKNVRPHWKSTHDSEGKATIIVEPLLLNPGDKFSLIALVNDFGGGLRCHARIAGISKIEHKSHRQPRFEATLWIRLFAAIGLVVYGLFQLKGVIASWNHSYAIGAIEGGLLALLTFFALGLWRIK
jgi:hypothetical protein